MPDGRGGYKSEARSAILRACTQAYRLPANRGDCNKFVKAVVNIATGGTVKFPDDANANTICGLIQKDPWTPLKVTGLDGVGTSKIAGLMAALEGKLVIVGWSNAGGNGHVAIVLDLTSSKKPPKPDAESGIGQLLRNRAVIAAGQLGHPENSKTYMKISSDGGFAENKLKEAVFGYVDIA